MANFDPAAKKVLKREAGYVFDPDDPGGETKYGISQRAYPAEDIKNLTLERAIELYRRDYWDALRLSEIRDQNLAELLLDSAINHGQGTAARMLQRAVKAQGGRVSIDGAIGPATLKAVAAADSSALARDIVSARAVLYQDIVRKKPNQAKFLKGWLARIKGFAPAGAGVAGFLLAAAAVIYILKKRGMV